jgi:hypothetical protein
MSNCKCSMAISVNGDGCRYCQPQEYIDKLSEWLEESRAEVMAYEEKIHANSAEPVQGEAVEYQQLSRYGNWDRIDKAAFDLGNLGQTPERFRALYTSPAKPDAELVELLKDAAVAMSAAHESLFDQCLSNGIKNAWGKPVDVSKVNDLQLFAKRIDAKLAEANKP